MAPRLLGGSTRRRVAIIGGGVALAAAIGLGANCAHQALGPGSGPAWYDATPLLASMRPDARATLRSVAGDRLEDLPLYDLDLTVEPDRAAFSVRETIWFTQREAEPLADIELRIDANVHAEAVPGGEAAPVRLVRGSCASPAKCEVSAPAPSTIRVVPATPLARGGRLKIEVELEGTLQTIDSSRTNVIAQGLEGLSSIGSSESAGDYGLLAIGDGIVSLGNFHAVLGPRKDGHWVRPPRTAMGDLGADEVVHVRAHIHAPAGLKLATTGVEIAPPKDEGDGKRLTEIGAAGVRDFALLGGVDLESANRDVGGVAVRSHFLKAERAAGERVLDTAARSLTLFERRFGPYPYVDLDVVEAALVGGAGGVEFSGLVTVASMLYRPPDQGVSGLNALVGLLGGGQNGMLAGLGPMLDSMLEFTVAHEVAHQYWHGLVGSDSREHPYLDEALAQYSAVLYMEDRYGKERADREATLQVKANYQMMRVLGTPDGQVDAPVDSFPSPIAYAGIVYGKAPYLYAALRKEVGDEAFFRALHDYADQQRFRIAAPGALVDLFARGPHDATVRSLAHRWLEERHGDDDLGGADLQGIVGAMLGGDEAKDLGPLLGIVQGMLGGDVPDLDALAPDAGAKPGKRRRDAGTP